MITVHTWKGAKRTGWTVLCVEGSVHAICGAARRGVEPRYIKSTALPIAAACVNWAYGCTLVA